MNGRQANATGFTLLEVMVATLIMGIAVVGLLSNLHVSLRNTERLTDYDRATQFAQHKMDEIITQAHFPLYQPISGTFAPDGLSKPEAGGWTAVATPFEAPPRAPAGELSLERIQLQVWWKKDNRRRTLTLEGVRQHYLTRDEAARLAVSP
mgnify:FL=1